jgi:hypothetical protein
MNLLQLCLTFFLAEDGAAGVELTATVSGELSRSGLGFGHGSDVLPWAGPVLSVSACGVIIARARVRAIAGSRTGSRTAGAARMGGLIGPKWHGRDGA